MYLFISPLAFFFFCRSTWHLLTSFFFFLEINFHVSFFSIDTISLSIVILHFSSFTASSNTIGSHIAWWQYSVTLSLIGLVTSYKSSRLLIFLGGLCELPLLELPLEKKDKDKVELIGDYKGVAIGSWWSSYLSFSSLRTDKKS